MSGLVLNYPSYSVYPKQRSEIKFEGNKRKEKKIIPLNFYLVNAFVCDRWSVMQD